MLVRSAKVKAEGRNVDREIRQLERVRGWATAHVFRVSPADATQTEERTKLEVKKLAKLGEVSAARLLAKELIAYSGVCVCVCTGPNGALTVPRRPRWREAGRRPDLGLTCSPGAHVRNKGEAQQRTSTHVLLSNGPPHLPSTSCNWRSNWPK